MTAKDLLMTSGPDGGSRQSGLQEPRYIDVGAKKTFASVALFSSTQDIDHVSYIPSTAFAVSYHHRRP